MPDSRKVILYISMSLDGYIAGLDESLDFLSPMAHEGEDYGYADFVASVDTVIIGRKTYEKVLSMGYDYPHTDKDVYIITRRKQESIGSFNFYAGDLRELVDKLKTQFGGDIYCDGGSEIANELMKKNLIDEYIISIIPVLLGGGTSLFKEGRTIKSLQFVNSKSFEKGLVQLHYSKIDLS
jgi:dihydrofolate reductase